MQHVTPTPIDPVPRAAERPPVAWWSNPDIIARGAVTFALVIGVLALVGWMVDVPELRALGPADRASMNRSCRLPIRYCISISKAVIPMTV